jgi:hypothetical protein
VLSNVSVIGRNGSSIQLPSLTLFEKRRSFIVLYMFGNAWPHPRTEGSEPILCKGLMETPVEEWMSVSAQGIERITGRIGSVLVVMEGIEILRLVLGCAASIRFCAAKCSKQIRSAASRGATEKN